MTKKKKDFNVQILYKAILEIPVKAEDEQEAISKVKELAGSAKILDKFILIDSSTAITGYTDFSAWDEINS